MTRRPVVKKVQKVHVTVRLSDSHHEGLLVSPEDKIVGRVRRASWSEAARSALKLADRRGYVAKNHAIILRMIADRDRAPSPAPAAAPAARAFTAEQITELVREVTRDVLQELRRGGDMVQELRRIADALERQYPPPPPDDDDEEEDDDEEDDDEDDR